jgi:hypothetical protein
MARKRSFRFGCPDVFAGRLSADRVGVGIPPILFCCGRLDQRARQRVVGVAMSRDIVRQEKARGQFPGAGSILAMLNICR